MTAHKNHTQNTNSDFQDTINQLNDSVRKHHEKNRDYENKLMIDQATGMMIQDLQIFMKSFEQVSIVALARLANNILTYGTFYGPKQDSNSIEDTSKSTETNQEAIHPDLSESNALNGLFQVVSEYGEAKSKIWDLINKTYVLKKDNPIKTQ